MHWLEDEEEEQMAAFSSQTVCVVRSLKPSFKSQQDSRLRPSGGILQPKFETMRPNFTFSRTCATNEIASVFFFSLFLTLVVEGNQSESKNLESGLTGGRPVCVRWAGNGTVSG